MKGACFELRAQFSFRYNLLSYPLRSQVKRHILVDSSSSSTTQKPFSSFPLTTLLGISFLLVSSMTWAVQHMQWLVEDTDNTDIRPFGIAFVLIIVGMTFWGGIRVGIGTSIFALGAMVFLISMGVHAPILRLRDIVELTMLMVVSIVIVASIHHAQQQRAHANQARDESEEARARLRAIMDTAPVAVLTCNANGVLDFANPEAENIWGHPLKPLAKEEWHQYRVFDANGSPMASEQMGMARALAHPGKVVSNEVQIERPDQSRVWVLTRSKTIQTSPSQEDSSPALLGAVTAFLDITRQKEVEEERTRLLETLLLHRPTEVPGLDIATHYAAAQSSIRVGGDFYDVFPLDDTQTAIVIGDLSGKGVAAAAQVAMVRNMLRYALYQGRPLADALGELNDMLHLHRLVNGFASLCVLIYDSCTNRLVYASCGHEPGLLLRASTNTIEEILPTGPVLGAFIGARYTQAETLLTPGDLIALYTDGISEAGRRSHQYLGSEGVADLLRHLPAKDSSEAALYHLIAGVDAFAPGPLHDDRCFLVAIIRPQEYSPETPSLPPSPLSS